VRKVAEETGCELEVRGKGTVGKRTSDEDDLYITVSGPDRQNIERARRMMEDVIINSVKDHERGRVLYELAAFQEHGICPVDVGRMRNFPVVHSQSHINPDKMMYKSVVFFPHAPDGGLSFHGALIGQGGKIHKDITFRSRCRIDIYGIGRNTGECDPYVLISSDDDRNVHDGLEMVQEILRERERELETKR